MSRDRPRFLVLTPALDGADGVSELSRQVVRTLLADPGGGRVEVWSLDGALRVDGVADVTFRSARRRRSTLVRWAMARAWAPLDGLTVIVMHAHLAPLAAPLAMRGARVVVFLIGVEVWRPLRARERYVVERADRLIAISNYTERRFRAANPDVRVNAMSVCALGVGPAPAGEAPARESGFALIVGRLWSEERYKGHDWLIDAWPAIRARVPDARLVVVGDGDDRARLEARAAAAGLRDAVRFTGRIADAELAAVYRASAFFLMPSTSEGFGLAYLEAMRAGKPCIALHGAADEIIEDGVSGFLFDAGETDRLIDAVVRLFVDRDLRARVGAAAASRVAREFTAAHFGRRFRAALGLPAEHVAIAPAVRASIAGLR